MELAKFTEDVEVIQKLGTFPNAEDGLSPEELKAKFDQAAVKIKAYLNDTLVPAVNTVGLAMPCIVTMTCVAGSVYSADRSFTQVLKAYQAGNPEIRCRITIDGSPLMLPLVNVTDDMLTYSATVLTSSISVCQTAEGVVALKHEIDGVCTVEVTGDGSAGYQADKTLAEITAANVSQYVRCRYGARYFPLVRVEDGVARFAAVVDGVEHRVEISDDGVTAVSEALGGGGAEDFHVYVEGSAGGKATVADGVNWYMIKTAHDAGRRCVCHWTVGVRTFHLPLIHDYRTNSNEHFYFSGIIDGYLVAKVHFSSAGAVDLSMTPFPQATRFLIQRSGDNYSILNSFDGEQLENAYSNTRLSAQVPSMIICSLQVTEDPISYMELPLVSRRELSGGDIYYVFSGTGEIDGQTFVFTVRLTNHGGVLSFTVEQRQIPEGLYVVNITSDESGVYSADKSYEEVLAVHNAGVRQIQCRLPIDDWYYSLPLCATSDGGLAYGGSASTLSALVMQSEGGVFVTLETLATQTDIDTIDVLIGGDS